MTLAEGTEIMAEGEDGDAFYILLEGEVRLGRRGRTVIDLGPGSYFGELALLDPGPRTATIEAKTRVTLGVLGARVFAVLLKEMPNMSDKLLRGLARRLREAESDVLH